MAKHQRTVVMNGSVLTEVFRNGGWLILTVAPAHAGQQKGITYHF